MKPGGDAFWEYNGHWSTSARWMKFVAERAEARAKKVANKLEAGLARWALGGEENSVPKCKILRITM
jgi:hypothetical protein